MSDAFYKSSFFLNYSMLLYGGVVVRELFRCLRLISRLFNLIEFN